MHIGIHLRLLCAGQHLKEIRHVEINSMGLALYYLETWVEVHSAVG